jgi:helicase
VETRERKVTFGKTGLSLNSCLGIEKTLREEEVNLNDVFIQGNEEMFLKIVLKCLSTTVEMEPKIALKNIEIKSNAKLEEFILSWIRGAKIEELRVIWINAVGEDNDELMNVYIEDCLAYKYPWGFTSVIFIASFILKEDWNNFNPNTINFPSRIKYGLTNQYSLWIRGIGVFSRDACELLANRYTGPKDMKYFTSWFLNLTVDEVSNMGVISKYTL